MSNCFIWPINNTLSGATTLGQSGPGSNGNERVFHIPQSSRTGASLSDCLVSYPGHLLRESYPLQWYSWCILQPQPIVLKHEWRLFHINVEWRVGLDFEEDLIIQNEILLLGWVENFAIFWQLICFILWVTKKQLSIQSRMEIVLDHLKTPFCEFFDLTLMPVLILSGKESLYWSFYLLLVAEASQAQEFSHGLEQVIIQISSVQTIC